ncbi:MAG: DUF1345 domain-containing protein [Methylobacter sp.]|uniref:DUF1345 domain-containing protein n=2 Tax=Methylobacter sp. TaxID=2051955 RepID=UPI002FE04CB9
MMLRHIKVRPRLMSTLMVIGTLHFLLLPESWRTVTRLLTAWDFGIFLYLILISVMMSKSDVDTIRSRATAQDEGAIIILVFTIVTVMASLVAIVAELATAKAQNDTSHAHIILTGVTVILSWMFMQAMFALHYTHEYYIRSSKTDNGGLEFPDKNLQPDYWDFIYFSFIIGTAAQTADINIVSQSFRRLVTLHCVIVFFFNLIILALTVNIGASLLA